MSKRIKKGAGRIKKEQRQANKEGLPRYYVFVRNNRNRYTKLVSRDKATDYTQGKYNKIGLRTHSLKDTYTKEEYE